MKSHLILGRLFGVPVGVNVFVFPFAVVLAWILAEIWLPGSAPDQPTSAYWFAAVVGVVAFMASLVAHEFGHSWVAQRNQVRVSEITLWIMGGVAKLEGEADDAGSEFRIALAGPAMSAVAALVAGAAAWWTQRLGGSDVMSALLVGLAWINALLAVFNLLPAYPMDGGRVLRAIIWRRTGRKITATRVSALWGQILAGVLAAVAVWMMFAISRFDGLWMIAFSVFLFSQARFEWSAAAPSPGLLELPISSVRRRLPSPLGPTATVADVEAALLADPGAPLVPLTDRHNAVSAMATRDGIGRIPPAQRAQVPATSIAESLVSLPRVEPAETVDAVVTRLGRGNTWWALVIDVDGSMGALLSTDVDGVLEVVRG